MEQEWAGQMNDLLIAIKKTVEEAKQQGQTALTNQQQADFEARYDRLIVQGFEANPSLPDPPVKKRGRKKQSKARTCLIGSKVTSVKCWRLCTILRCRLTTIWRNVTCA